MSQPRREHHRQWQQGQEDVYQDHSGADWASQLEDMGDQCGQEEDITRGADDEDDHEDSDRREEDQEEIGKLEGWLGCHLDPN